MAGEFRLLDCLMREGSDLTFSFTADGFHDTVHEMARDEARHGKAFKGLLERYFG